MVPTLRPDVLVAERATLAEGPLWDLDTATLHWVDIEERAIRSLGTDGIVDERRVPDKPGCVALDVDGHFVVGFPDGVWVATDHGWERLVALDADDPTIRLNDGKVAPDGRLVVGSMVEDQATRRGRLWSVGADGEAVALLDRVAVSNGLAWSADGGTFFYIDTPSRKVRRWPWTGDGPLDGEGEVVVRVPNDVGFPDGMAIDDEGCLWVAIWGGSAVHRYTPEGDLDTVVEVPTARVSSCAFAGPGLTTLVITTASVDLAGPALATDPHAGQVFAVEAGVSGPPPRRFGHP